MCSSWETGPSTMPIGSCLRRVQSSVWTLGKRCQNRGIWGNVYETETWHSKLWGNMIVAHMNKENSRTQKLQIPHHFSLIKCIDAICGCAFFLGRKPAWRTVSSCAHDDVLITRRPMASPSISTPIFGLWKKQNWLLVWHLSQFVHCTHGCQEKRDPSDT